MSKNFYAFDVTGFLNESIGRFLSEIEDFAIEMAHADDQEDRFNLLTRIQEIIEQCNAVLR